MKLGQLYKSALYEETQEELEEYANFMTQVKVINLDLSLNLIFFSNIIALDQHSK